MALIKCLTKAESKFLRDLGVAASDFQWLDNEISIHQTNGSGITRIFPKVIVYEAAAVEFTKAPLQYTVDRTSQGNGKTLINFIDWNV